MRPLDRTSSRICAICLLTLSLISGYFTPRILAAR